MYARSLILVSSFASLLTAAKPNQDALQPITVPTDGIVYPLPSIGLPAIPEGRYTETAESPTLHYSRAIKRLAEAQKMEQSAATKQLHSAWQEMLRKNGPDSLETSRAYAAFLSQYAVDLNKAVRVYDEVGHTLEGMQASDGEQKDDSGEQAITGDLEELVRSEDVERSYTDAACIVDPDSCVPPDPDNARIVSEISSLITMLDTGGPTGELKPELLAKKASLLKRRAQLVMLLTRRAAQALALRVVAPKDANGNIKKMVVPVQASNNATERAKHYRPADPYRD